MIYLHITGFTGKNATDFKIEYIEALNEMKRYLSASFQQLNLICQRFKH